MGNWLRGQRGILVILAVVVVIALAVVATGWVIGDSDEDEGITGSVTASQVA